MSYPNDAPSYDMGTIWQSGNYTPNNIVRTIRDNYTPINKNAMRNSVGAEISAIQNYVNSKYLGRPTLPITSGFIDTLLINSGNAFDPAGNECRLIVEGKVLFNPGQSSGVSFQGDNSFINRIKSLDQQLVISTDLTPNDSATSLTIDAVNNLTSITSNIYTSKAINVGPSSYDTSLTDGSLGVVSGRFDETLVVGSGNIYDTTVFTVVGKVYMNLAQSSGMFFTGDNMFINRIKSYDSQLVISTALSPGGAETYLTIDAVDDSTSISSKLAVVGNFGCNNATPTGVATCITDANSLPQACTAISGILDVLKNYGMMAAS